MWVLVPFKGFLPGWFGSFVCLKKFNFTVITHADRNLPPCIDFVVSGDVVYLVALI